MNTDNELVLDKRNSKTKWIEEKFISQIVFFLFFDKNLPLVEI